MKKITSALLTLFLLYSFSMRLNAQALTSCIVTAEAIPLNPQTQQYNYFKVKVTLNEPYDQNVTVTGYIFDAGSYDTNHPFNLTVTSGQSSAETSATFYQTYPTSVAEVEINSISPYLVTSNDVYYTTHIECHSFPVSYSAYAKPFIDSLRIAQNYLKGLISPNGISQIVDFIDYLADNGTSATASHYSISSNAINAYESKINATQAILEDMIIDTYGQVDSITFSQAIDLFNTVLYSQAARMVPGEIDGCFVLWMACMLPVDAAYIGGMGNCSVVYLFSSNLGKKCFRRMKAHLMAGIELCDGGYFACSGHSIGQ